jgi:MFS family permease
MVCHECGKPVQAGQRFCSSCGASLRGVTDTTEPMSPARPSTSPPATEPTEEWAAHNPAWAKTGTVPATAATATDPARSGLESVPDLKVRDPDVWALTSETYGVQPDVVIDPVRTTEMPLYPTGAPPPVMPFRFGAVMLCGILAAIVALAGTFTTTVEITSDATLVPSDTAPAEFRTGTWMLDDLADNMSIAILIAAVLLVIGGVAAGFRWRWGSGLAGGAGLGLTGLVALAIGLAQFPIDAAREFAAVPNAQQFTLTITRDVGYWLLLASAALGLVVFFASINDAFGDRRSGLNPWIAALGALATVVAVLGPMIPEGTAVFSDNWYLREGPGEPAALLLLGRLVQLALLAITGTVGYLCVRRWGLAVAIGGALPIVWLAASTLFDLTDRPVGPAFANPGADEIELHGVTIIGLSAVVAIGILAVVAAYDQSVRERR